MRKSIPKLATPFKCYIYCTKSPKGWAFIDSPDVRRDGKVIGEFVCNKIHEYEAEFHEDNGTYQDIREIFRSEDDTDDDCRDFRIITSNEDHKPDNCKLCRESCLTFNELKRYMGGECFCSTFYGWHISELKIYDKPKELSEFKPAFCRGKHCWTCESLTPYKPTCKLKKPPLSWRYVDEREGDV